MDLHPSREMVASGQRAGRNRKTQAHIRIWSTETLQTLYVFGMGEFEVGVAAVAFSQLVTISHEILKKIIFLIILERRKLCSGCRRRKRKHPVGLAVAMGSSSGKSCGEYEAINANNPGGVQGGFWATNVSP